MVKIMNHMDSGLNNWIAEKVNNPEGIALDIGCGGGETIYHLLKSNKLDHMIGIDYSLDSVKIAIRKNKDFIKKEKAEIIQGDVTALPFSQNFFDMILTVRSHYFWSDYDKAFTEIFRTLKPNGKMMIFSERYKIQYHMKRYNTEESMVQFLTTVGFHNIKPEETRYASFSGYRGCACI